MLKDLKGKTVFDLTLEEFHALFCGDRRERPDCDRDPKTVNICQQLVNDGIWDSLFRKRSQGK